MTTALYTNSTILYPNYTVSSTVHTTPCTALYIVNRPVHWLHDYNMHSSVHRVQFCAQITWLHRVQFRKQITWLHRDSHLHWLHCVPPVRSVHLVQPWTSTKTCTAPSTAYTRTVQHTTPSTALLHYYSPPVHNSIVDYTLFGPVHQLQSCTPCTALYTSYYTTTLSRTLNTGYSPV